MTGINTAKVVAGGLLAGVVYNAIDFVINGMLLMNDFAANASRLGLAPETQTAPKVAATWIAIDFILGILVVFIYAAIRPRFGPGVKTAAIAGFTLWIVGASLVLGFAMSGMFTMAIWTKMLVPTLVNSIAGAVVGAWAYKEA